MKGVGDTPGSSHANPIQKEEKIFPGGVMGSMESSRADMVGDPQIYYHSASNNPLEPCSGRPEAECCPNSAKRKPTLIP